MILTVKLTPNASKNAIIGWDVDSQGQRVLKCSVTTIPEDGKANQALIKLLSKQLNISKSSITLISGHTARIKRLNLDDVTEQDLPS